MKEIGLKLKEKREENGVSLEEAASDLKIKENEIKSIEEGQKEDFDDIVALKELIKDYAKYLGLDGDALLDEFNEYLFEQTSRISLEEIEMARKEKEEKEKNMKILSPYTITKKDKKKIFIGIAIIIFIILVGIISYIIISNQNKNDFISSEISYKIGE